MKKICYLFFGIIFIGNAALCQVKKDYLNPKLPLDKRVESLLSQMTNEEKAAQLCLIDSKMTLLDANGNINEKKVLQYFKNGVGSIWFNQVRMPLDKAIKLNNTIQKVLTEQTRLGIPTFFIGEGLHGFMAPGSTVFPQAIALGGTWDTTLVEKVFTAAAKEMRAKGYQQALAPVLDLSREPRWGRTEETYSEDPYLTARIGKAAVLGFQGRKLSDLKTDHVISSLKHFAGHGQGEGGNNTAPVVCDERYFRENHLYPFEVAVKEAQVQSIMPSYNEWSSIPNHSNPWLLKEVLRKEWGFNGYVISDQGGVEDLYRKHNVAKDSAQAVKMALEAGVDFEIMDVKSFYSYIPKLVKAGLISEATLNDAVRNVLRAKLSLGMFEKPYADLAYAQQVTNCDAHKAIALEAAHKAMVLLKNDKSLLPLDASKIKKLAVIGPNAAEIHLGGYTHEPRIGTPVLEGIKKIADGKFDVLYAEGCKISVNPGSFWDMHNPVLADEATDNALIREAVKVAEQCDVVLLVIGENESTCREAWSEDHRGDRDDLNLIGHQEQLVKEILKTGKPVVVLLINGRPITINYVAQNVPAIIEGWYLGQETGTAVADVLFGKVNPSGKLSVTIPKTVGELPCYYSKKVTRSRSYLFDEFVPLWPFGYGLSYTTFEYGQPHMENAKIGQGRNAKVTVNVRNTGRVEGDEVVQLYIRDKVSSVTRPIMELKDFARINLNPGENKDVTFTITPEKLRFYNRQMKRVVEPGEFEVMTGPNSANVQKVSFWVQ